MNLFLNYVCFYFINRYLPGTVDVWMRSVIKQVVNQRDSNKERRNDFLQAVLDQRDIKGRDIYDETTVIGHALSFLTDGHETSSGLISYCLYQVYCAFLIVQKNDSNYNYIYNYS